MIVVAFIMVAAGTAYHRAGALADWYAGFAARHLPPPASSLAPASTSTGAFFYCARQVARRMGALSVETFPSEEQSSTVELGDGRYRISSSVLRSEPDGGSARIAFVCTTHLDRGRWVLDDLDIPEVALR